MPGETSYIVCDEGYTMYKPVFVTCQSDGKWRTVFDSPNLNVCTGQGFVTSTVVPNTY